MFQKHETEKPSHAWVWPTVVAAVIIGLVCIQMLRVNRPKDAEPSELPRVYTAAGSLIDGQITIPARDFYSSRIDLNRPSKLVGSFRTPNIRSTVSVLVLTEPEFERWKIGSDYVALAQTGNVPGGKINRALVEGVFFLVIDNRHGESEQPLYADFSLDR